MKWGNQFKDNCESSCKAFIEIFRLGWKLPYRTSEPIKWISRDVNLCADEIAKHTMRCRCNFSRTWDWWTSEDLLNSNILVFTDGGAKRSDKCSSSAYVIGFLRILSNGGSRWTPIAAWGTFYNEYKSSFEVELRAIEQATAETLALLKRTNWPAFCESLFRALTVLSLFINADPRPDFVLCEKKRCA